MAILPGLLKHGGVRVQEYTSWTLSEVSNEWTGPRSLPSGTFLTGFEALGDLPHGQAS